MTNTSTATIQIVPEFNVEDFTAQLRVAIAGSLRKIADELDTPAAAPTSPRYSYVQIGDREGILDSQQPGKWSDYGLVSSNPEMARIDRQYVESEVRALNNSDYAGDDVTWGDIFQLTPADTREPALWGYHIGDRVKYTEVGEGRTGDVRIVGAVFNGGLRLDLSPTTGIGYGYASRPADITPA